MSKTEAETAEKSKTKLSVADLAFEKQGGLLPVIAQDESSGAVLIWLMQILRQLRKLKKADLRITGHVRATHSGKKVKALDICRKLWKCWWTVMKIHCFIKCNKAVLPAIPAQLTVFSGNCQPIQKAIKNELGYSTE